MYHTQAHRTPVFYRNNMRVCSFIILTYMIENSFYSLIRLVASLLNLCTYIYMNDCKNQKKQRRVNDMTRNYFPPLDSMVKCLWLFLPLSRSVVALHQHCICIQYRAGCFSVRCRRQTGDSVGRRLGSVSLFTQKFSPRFPTHLGSQGSISSVSSIKLNP